MKRDYLKTIIMEEFISVLKEVGVPCGKCGSACPCKNECENPHPTGFLIGNKAIQLNTGLKPIDQSATCNCGSNEPDVTPRMPENQVTQFGNTPPFVDNSVDMNVPGYKLPAYTYMPGDLTGRTEKLKQILNTLRGKSKDDGVYNGKSVKLNHPVSSDTHITFYVKKEGVIKEYKIKKK